MDELKLTGVETGVILSIYPVLFYEQHVKEAKATAAVGQLGFAGEKRVETA